MKQNKLFNKCCDNCDPNTRDEVWKQMDKELGREENRGNSSKIPSNSPKQTLEQAAGELCFLESIVRDTRGLMSIVRDTRELISDVYGRMCKIEQTYEQFGYTLPLIEGILKEYLETLKKQHPSE